MLKDLVTVEWAPASDPLDPAPSWVDITDQVRAVEWETGARNSREEAVAAGTFSIEFNNRGDVGGAVVADPTAWYRWRQVRVVRTVDDLPLMAGTLTGIDHDFNRTPHAVFSRMVGRDHIGLLSEGSTDADFATYATGAPLGQVEAKRIGGVDGYVTDGGAADVATWLLPGIDVQFAAPMPVFVESKQTGNALALLRDYLDFERGHLVTPAGGGLVFYGRGTLTVAAASAAEYTLSDDPGDWPGGAYRYLRGGLVWANPDDSYVDDAVVGVAGVKDPQRVHETPTGYPPSSWTRADRTTLVDTHWAKATAQMVVSLGRQTDAYPRQVEMYVAGPVATSVDTNHPGANAAMLSVVELTHEGSVYRLLIVGARHRIDQEGWKYTPSFLSLDRVTAAFGGAGLFTLGTSALGGSDILGP